MVHLQHLLPWDQLALSTGQVEKAILEAHWRSFSLQYCFATNSTTLQARRVGLRTTFSIEAALLSGAAMADAALYRGMDTSLPYNGACWLPLLEVWRRVFDDCAKVCGWAHETRNLPNNFV